MRVRRREMIRIPLSSRTIGGLESESLLPRDG